MVSCIHNEIIHSNKDEISNFVEIYVSAYFHVDVFYSSSGLVCEPNLFSYVNNKSAFSR